MDSKAETESPFMRNLDKITSSMTVVELNNLVVSLRPTARKAKVAVVHKLSRQIKHLRKLKGTEEKVAANNKKADRYGLEIEMLKKLTVDILVKNALKNTSPISDIGKLPDPESRILLRIACQKAMVEKVAAWRSRHDDWKSLAAYLLSKNAGHRYKKPKPVKEKEKTKKAKQRKRDKAKPWEKKKDKSGKEIGDEEQSGKQEDDAGDDENQSDSEGELKVTKATPKSRKLGATTAKITKAKGKMKVQSGSSDSESVDDGELSSESDDEDEGEEDSERTSEEDTSSEERSDVELRDKMRNTGVKKGVLDACVASSDEESEDTVQKAVSDSSGSSDSDEGDGSDDDDGGRSHEENSISETTKVQKKSTEAKISNKAQWTKDKEMVVKKLNLNALEESDEIIGKDSDSQENVAFLFKSESGSTSKVEKQSSAGKAKKDSFFCGVDSEGSGSDGSESDSDYNSDSDNENQIVKKRQESTFVGSLSAGKFTSGDNFTQRTHERGGFQGHKPRFGGQSHVDKYGGKKGQGQGDRGGFHAGGFRGEGQGHREKSWKDRSHQSQERKPVTDTRKRPATEEINEKLHPSWAASKKRKEQQTQIQAFQGKKITFDDDD